MEQMVFLGFIIGLSFLGERSGVGIYKIIAGLISFAFALTLVTDTILLVVFFGLGLYLIVSVFVSPSK